MSDVLAVDTESQIFRVGDPKTKIGVIEGDGEIQKAN